MTALLRMQDHSCFQRFFRVNIDSTAEHSRNSGVFSRRRVAVNGSAAALPESLLCVELFLAGGERLRQMTPCDGWRPLQGVERRLAVRASLVGGALRKSANRRVARPRVFLQRKRRVSAGLTSLSPCSLSARQNVLVQVWSGTPGASREFFWQTICIICLGTYYCRRTIISLFCNRRKMAVSANYFSVVITLCESQVSTPPGFISKHPTR